MGDLFGLEAVGPKSTAGKVAQVLLGDVMKFFPSTNLMKDETVLSRQLTLLLFTALDRVREQYTATANDQKLAEEAYAALVTAHKRRRLGVNAAVAAGGTA